MMKTSLSATLVVSAAFSLACSKKAPPPPPGPGASDDRMFVPERLPSAQKEGETGVTLKLVASTLVQAAGHAELYVAVRNEGKTPSCGGGIVTDFLDDGGTVATVGAALQGKHLYRLDANTILGCIDPGEVALGAVTNIPPSVIIGSLRSLKHSFPMFALDHPVSIDALALGPIERLAKDGGTAYKGVLTNKLSVAVNSPSVTVFAVNRAGRPVGVATASLATDVAPGGTWPFETTAVADAGADFVAYPSASVGPAGAATAGNGPAR